jgi:hypothetical protein
MAILTGKYWDLTEGAFDKFLVWLSPDRDQAALKYEQIRRGLIAIFEARGCAEAEELADVTIDRVVKRLREMADIYDGDPAPYFYAVAHCVQLEYEYAKKNPPVPALVSSLNDNSSQWAMAALPDTQNNQVPSVALSNKRTNFSLSESRLALYLLASTVVASTLLQLLTDDEMVIFFGTLSLAIISTWIWAWLRKIRLALQYFRGIQQSRPEQPLLGDLGNARQQ